MESLPVAAVDMSVIGLFHEAGTFVKLIMVLLFSMSVLTWAVWFAKGKQFGSLKRKANKFEEAFWSHGSDVEGFFAANKNHNMDHPLAHVFLVGLEEWERDSKFEGEAKLARIRRMIDAAMTRELEALEGWLPFLATVGSIAPFIGLLGTVWGVMSAFQGIGAAKSASLAVVAPGIAEALLATALGLFAAIPAVVAYNRLASSMGRYAGRVEAFVGEFLSILEALPEKKKKTSRK